LGVFVSVSTEHTFAVHNGTSSDSDGEDDDSSNSNNEGRSRFFWDNSWVRINRGWGFVNGSNIGIITSLVEVTSSFRTAVGESGRSTWNLDKSFLVSISIILKNSSSEDSFVIKSISSNISQTIKVTEIP